ncbi:MAG: hypothetical protein ABSF14_23135 [Terriglobia bacterium]|jgi:hypothetical protein
MSETGIAKAEDFQQALHRTNVERVTLPRSGLTVLLCRPPVFAALRLGREGTKLQTKITEAAPEGIKAEDIVALSDWVTETLSRLFLQPRFSGAPKPGEIGLGDILVDDLKYIFRWLRGEVFSTGTRDSGSGIGESNPESQTPNPGSSTEDLAPFPGEPRAASVLRGSGEAQPVPPQPTAGAHGDAGVCVGLCRG